ncbi:MAG: tRNA preQ1(34) S-adenosylmethionine ribosyltransferase-isomerase QueA, partial [Desulfonatronovibrionaceae bacterium]
LVVNNTRVLPARLRGLKDTGGRVEFLLLTPLPLITPAESGSKSRARLECLLKCSRGPRAGSTVHFPDGAQFVVHEHQSMGRCAGEFFWSGNLADYFIRNGNMPLPPYIQRPDRDSDRERYQTVYAAEDKNGSVAAPTAGLHFTPDLREKLERLGFGWAEVTLYVGYGTFSPVRTADIRDHKMHAEYIEVSPENARTVQQAREKGRKVVAVGTTSARTLESLGTQQQILTGYRGWTDLFIYPGYRFKVVDQLITNFHLPKSSLMMMVSALAGRKNILNAYEQAKEQGFRFFSYGDAMFIA